MSLNTNKIQLLCGDCLDLMPNIPAHSIDLILCDLPYGTTACKWDQVIPFDALWEQYNRVIKDNDTIVLFGSEPFSSNLRLSNLKNYKYDLIWQKEKPTNFLQLKHRFGKLTENICIFYNNKPTYNPQKTYTNNRVHNKPQQKNNSSITTALGFSNIIPYNDDGSRYPNDILKFNRVPLGKTIHPTQKPVALLEYLIKTYTNEGDLVLDNCMGSGSTGVAAVQTNRRFIGIEKEPKYFEIAQKRIYQATGKPLPKDVKLDIPIQLKFGTD